MKNVIKFLYLICIAVFLTQCRQSTELSKADVILELKTKLRNDPDLKLLAVNLKEYDGKLSNDYFNTSKANDKYVEKNIQRVENGEKQAVYEEAGYKHADEYVKYWNTYLDHFKLLRARYESYINKLGKEEYYTVFQEVSDEVVPNAE
jgi:hypothetical protein